MESEIWRPDVIVLGPGGAKGFLELGCLKRLSDEPNFLDNVRYWTGVSVGAAIALLIVIGYTLTEIIELCLDVNIIRDVVSIDINEAKEKFGLIRIKTIEDRLGKTVKKKYGFIPTLRQLYEFTDIIFTAVTFNLDKMRIEYLDKDTEPELSCVDACLMSMAIPLLTQPRKYKGNIYVDGAIGASYPVLYHDNDENKVLGLYISCEQDYYCSDNKISTFGYRLIQAGMKSLRDVEIDNSSSNVKHIGLHTNVKDTTGLSVDEETRRDMIAEGERCADEFLKINQDPDKYDISLDDEEEIPTLNETLGQLTNSVKDFIDIITHNIKEEDDVLCIPLNSEMKSRLKETEWNLKE